MYEVVCWPEVKALMELDGFKENAYLVNDEKGIKDFGYFAYFVDAEWLKEHTK